MYNELCETEESDSALWLGLNIDFCPVASSSGLVWS